METSEYDVVVLGAGPVGQVAADRCRAAGLSVAVVERELVGGECSYWGCVPSKAMLRPVLALNDARRVDGARSAVTGRVEAEGVFRRRDKYTTNWDDSGQAAWVGSIGADLVRGQGRLDGPRRVSVETPDDRVVVLTARQAVIMAPGSRAALPDIPGIAEARPWTNRRATDEHMIPGRLVVVGGGPVGVEMATAWQALGSQVTLVSQTSLLPRMEPFAGQMVERGLKEAGTEVRTGVAVTELRRPDPDGPVTVSLEDGVELVADEVLMAIGRVPLTGDLGLQTVGLTPGTWVDVDDTCTVRGVDGDWLYAIGDVNHRALLTHEGKYQSRIVGNVIAARATGTAVDTAAWSPYVASADRHAVPQVIFSDPEAGMAGLTASEAERAGHRVAVVDVDMVKAVGTLLWADDYSGHARMVVDLDSETLLGVTFVGPGVADLLHSATVAIAGQVPIDRLWHAVPVFPTISEVWLRLLEAYRDR
ncbi:NAD(P)/FAD-dependent oxidoreductase [Actinoplanes sp. TBRC 11911]|uniref:dihydrolipoyl dehydrogenase family protein n=1 Tax=Actinoplanes sp. TBRC 11911 TaxID=2729386 RepID=UPI00145E3A68|nr:NAD(P)/FAD-dependent oxidoreductase [Actinoplanes sp. TBRC 11911]NMO55328.1 NAD(P)/FAD-dependent oxidoreductase [Actinoplanes sp. TBRC 11911]